MKEKLLNDVTKYDLLLSNYLEDNYDNFTLAGYIDYLSKYDGSKKALCHIDKNKKRTEFTYEDLSKLSNKMANYLKKQGVKKGDVVALILRNNYEYYIVSLALQKLGAVAMTLQYTNKEDQYKSIFERSNPKCIIADDYEIIQGKNNSSFVLNEINKASNKEIIKICTYPKSKYSNEWRHIDNYLNESDKFECEHVKITDLGYLFSTSGTTGKPKLVMHNYGFALSHFYTGLWYGIKKGKKHYTIADSGWAMGSWNMSATLLHQGTAYINDYDRFNPKYILNCLQEEKINSLCAPRSILIPLLNYLDYNSDKFKINLEIISSAGEPLDKQTKDRCKKHFNVIPKEGYGMTEAVLPIYEDNNGKKIVSPLYNTVTIEKVPGQVNGEIIVKGGKIGLLIGYLEKYVTSKDHYTLYRKPPIESSNIVWHTGDAGYYDYNGNVLCDGRLGNTVKVNDCLVNKLVVENTIKLHPYVYDCIVESKKDDESGNILYAYVELKDNCFMDADMIKQFVKMKLPDYCRPKYVEIRKLERTSNGKLKRNDTVEPPEKFLSLTYKKAY